MKTFEELKQELIDIVSPLKPCKEQFDIAKESQTQAELLQVIYDNLGWCIENKCITNEYLSQFDSEILLASGVANTGKENTGLANSGNWNSGYRNSGNSNSGNWNSGYRNSGNSNSGNWNSGDRNSGNWNSGNWNSGDRNSGNWNSGYRNSGNSNSGNWNSGDSNSGDSNSGYRNSGAFCTDNNPKIKLFDTETDMGVREWEQHPAYKLMSNGLNFNFWIWESEMSESEKEKFPAYKTTGGYLKAIPHKEGWANFWGNLSEENKKIFTSLPHFNSEKFEEVTGIKI